MKDFENTLHHFTSYITIITWFTGSFFFFLPNMFTFSVLCVFNQVEDKLLTTDNCCMELLGQESPDQATKISHFSSFPNTGEATPSSGIF